MKIPRLGGTLGSLLGAALFVAPFVACGGSDAAIGDSTKHDGGSGDDAGGSTGDDTAEGGTAGDDAGQDGASSSGTTVFVILMENHSWSTIKDNKSAPYINTKLLPMAAHAENYSTPPSNHPSEPNYVWLEAGGNLGITNDDDPDKNHQSTKDHFTAQLETAGISWKAYAEGISGNDCPLSSSGLYATKHTPQLFFDDVTDTNSPTSAHCKDHVRPYKELAGDLTNNKVARYNFITPNLCNDMHGETFGTTCQALIADLVKSGDTWLSNEVPKILASNAYKNGGILFVLWDEGDESLGQTASDGPVPFFVVSSKAKAGYAAPGAYTHSSMLRSLEKIFGVPYLRGAQTATDLSDLFTSPL